MIKYNCTNCNFEGFFKLTGKSDELKEITCKVCDSPIDMKYNDKKHCYQSLNMFK